MRKILTKATVRKMIYLTIKYIIDNDIAYKPSVKSILQELVDYELNPIRDVTKFMLITGQNAYKCPECGNTLRFELCPYTRCSKCGRIYQLHSSKIDVFQICEMCHLKDTPQCSINIVKDLESNKPKFIIDLDKKGRKK